MGHRAVGGIVDRALKKCHRFADDIEKIDEKIEAVEMEWKTHYTTIKNDKARDAFAKYDALDGLEKDCAPRVRNLLKKRAIYDINLLINELDYKIIDINEDPAINGQTKMGNRAFTMRRFMRHYNKEILRTTPLSSSTKRDGQLIAPFLWGWNQLKKQHEIQLKKYLMFHPGVITTRSVARSQREQVKNHETRRQQQLEMDKNLQPTWVDKEALCLKHL
jgi:hypothetical protein